MTDITKQPWGIEETDRKLWIGPMRADGKKVNAVAVSIDLNPAYRPEVLEEQRKIAELIASAPEQAATIERLRAALERIKDTDTGHDASQGWDAALHMWAIADEVLEKNDGQR